MNNPNFSRCRSCGNEMDEIEAITRGALEDREGPLCPICKGKEQKPLKMKTLLDEIHDPGRFALVAFLAGGRQ